MLIHSRAGNTVEVDEGGVLLINGRLPELVTELDGGWLRASSIFLRIKRPKKVGSCRKRKKALAAAVKRFRFSFKYKQG